MRDDREGGVGSPPEPFAKGLRSCGNDWLSMPPACHRMNASGGAEEKVGKVSGTKYRHFTLKRFLTPFHS